MQTAGINRSDYKTMELSTQLIAQEAERRGYSIEILDKRDNFIHIYGKERNEYIKQATRTRADSYIAPLIMENKLVTKKLLKNAGIAIPEGGEYSEIEEAMDQFSTWKDKSFVIKPNSTNFGKAVEMFPHGSNKKEYQLALNNAFKEDNLVLIEDLLDGKEYRFLVVGDRVRAVLHRIPANIIGDGISSIKKLVEIKNRNPMRQKGYISPLEKIQLGETELEFINAHDLTINSIPEKDQLVYLRQNSNISTGGDSIDLTDSIHPGYKEIAVAAAHTVGAKICGVDLISKNILEAPNNGNYGIIELNFNPALHIHDFPAEGENRKVEKHVLDLLELW
jgi:glutamate--cysteine ligase/glutathione synthase